ncbi:hypothetical protein D6_0243 [Aeromonas phage D6]|uniref:Uncharacterized protein n=1 Tax=Aeromonas phage D6 TaxID=2593322 RepID=A0ACD0UHX2_9CAUD|nr:hypothetical protein PQC08_gp032 [Aeromonas phage D6]QDJ97417.2 hypothetical protein D6_0243 [Aeromonas phage D6]
MEEQFRSSFFAVLPRKTDDCIIAMAKRLGVIMNVMKMIHAPLDNLGEYHVGMFPEDPERVYLMDLNFHEHNSMVIHRYTKHEMGELSKIFKSVLTSMQFARNATIKFDIAEYGVSVIKGASIEIRNLEHVHRPNLTMRFWGRASDKDPSGELDWFSQTERALLVLSEIFGAMHELNEPGKKGKLSTVMRLFKKHSSEHELSEKQFVDFIGATRPDRRELINDIIMIGHSLSDGPVHHSGLTFASTADHYHLALDKGEHLPALINSFSKVVRGEDAVDHFTEYNGEYPWMSHSFMGYSAKKGMPAWRDRTVVMGYNTYMKTGRFSTLTSVDVLEYIVQVLIEIEERVKRLVELYPPKTK